MNRQFLAKLLFLPLMLAFWAPGSLAQNSNSAQQPAQNTEILGENERLPFMQTDQSADAAEPSSGGLLVRTLGAMLLIGGLIFFGAWGAKKLGLGSFKAKSSTDNLDLAILSSVSLGSGRTISTVRFGERVLLVGSTAQAFTLLAEETAGGEKNSLAGSRSVAEMLADETLTFDDEFAEAQNRLDLWEEKGGESR